MVHHSRTELPPGPVHSPSPINATTQGYYVIDSPAGGGGERDYRIQTSPPGRERERERERLPRRVGTGLPVSFNSSSLHAPID
jgi:hypothetical protein